MFSTCASGCAPLVHQCPGTAAGVVRPHQLATSRWWAGSPGSGIERR